MISTGIVRSIDNLGRVVLPKELRNTYSITPDTPLEIFTDGESIVLRKYRAQGACVFCGEISPTQFCCTGSMFARPAARRWGNKASIKSKAGHPRWMLCLFFVSVLLAGEPCLPPTFSMGQRLHSPFFSPRMDSSAFLTRLNRLVAWRG